MILYLTVVAISWKDARNPNAKVETGFELGRDPKCTAAVLWVIPFDSVTLDLLTVSLWILLGPVHCSSTVGHPF